jgi:hypothetical protein
MARNVPVLMYMALSGKPAGHPHGANVGRKDDLQTPSHLPAPGNGRRNRSTIFTPYGILILMLGPIFVEFVFYLKAKS